MQGEGKARQVFCVALPLWPASPACLLSSVENQRNPSAAWRRQAKPKMKQRSCRWGAVCSPWGQKGGTALAEAGLCQPGLCQGSLVPACCSQDGRGEPALQLVSHVHNMTVSAWAYPHIRIPQKQRRSPLFLSAVWCMPR